VGGKHSGLHLTFCYKDEKQLQSATHTACHGYTQSSGDYTFIKATDSGEKPDSTLKINGNVVWPASITDLDEAPDIGYSHLEE
jgi:hypothetical protein